MILSRPHIALIPDFINALNEGDFNHMALAKFGDEPIDVIKENPNAYLERLNNSEPRLVKVPNGQTHILSQHEILWAYTGENKFIGCASFRYDHSNPLIDDYCGHLGMCIRKSLRSSIYGARIAESAMRIFVDKGFATIRVSAKPTNRPSDRLMAKFGKLISDADVFGYGPNHLYEIRLMDVLKPSLRGTQ